MPATILHFPNTVIQRLTREYMQVSGKYYCVHYFPSADTLVVLPNDKKYKIVHKSDEGSVYYECNTSNKRVVGFQISGITHFFNNHSDLKNRPFAWQKTWDVAQLIYTIALSVDGGLQALFGEDAKDVRAILCTYKFSVSITPN